MCPRNLPEPAIGYDGGTFNLYEGCASNPIQYSDPTGLDWWPPSAWGYNRAERIRRHQAHLRNLAARHALIAAKKRREQEQLNRKTVKPCSKEDLEKRKKALEKELAEIARIINNLLWDARALPNKVRFAGKDGAAMGLNDGILGYSQAVHNVASLWGNLYDPPDLSQGAFNKKDFDFAVGGGYVSIGFGAAALGVGAAAELGISTIGDATLGEIAASVSATVQGPLTDAAIGAVLGAPTWAAIEANTFFVKHQQAYQFTTSVINHDPAAVAGSTWEAAATVARQILLSP